MELYDIYIKNSSRMKSDVSEFRLISIKENLYIGQDRENNIVLVLSHSQMNGNIFQMRTKKLSLELNRDVSFEFQGVQHFKRVNLIRCFQESEKEIQIFLDLCEVFFMSIEAISEEEFSETFKTLVLFFKDKREVSDMELQGLFAELFTIYHYQSTFDFAKYWQSKGKMKFDFSITGKIKLEIKSTLKTERRHHFKHDQLLSSLYDIYVLSYLMKEDDQGISLLYLLQECKKILKEYPEKIIRIEETLYQVEGKRLEKMRFSEEYLIAYHKFFDASQLPKFQELTPDGVANAEYDCILDNIKDVSIETILGKFAQCE